MTVKEQRSFMFDLFHGNSKSGIVPNVQQLIAREEPYDRLFQQRDENIVRNNDNRKHHLWPSLTRGEKNFYIDKHITLEEVLSQRDYKSKELLQGRTIHNHARTTLANVRKACSLVKDLLKEDGTPVKSGETIEDVMETMLEEMYAMLNGKKNVEEEGVVRIADDDVSDGEDVVGTNPSGVTDSNRNDERPASWFFHGFMAVLLFGPLAPKEQRLSFFFSSDPLPADKKSFGRAAARAERKKTEDKERSLNVVAGSKNARGMSVSERVKLAKLEIQVGRYNKDLLDSNVLTLRVEASLLESKLERAMKRAATTSNFDQVDQLEAELDEVRAAIVALRTQQNKNKHGVKRCHDLLTANDEQAQEADEADAQSISTRTTSDLTNANSTN